LGLFIAKQGVGKLTTKRLAKEVGISEAAIYKYFESKNDILVFALKFVQENLHKKITEIDSDTGDSLQKLLRVIRFQFNLLEENQGIPRVIFSEQIYLGSHLLREMYLQNINGYYAFLHGIIQEGIEKGTFRKDLNVDMAATSCMGLVQTTVFRWSIEGNGKGLINRADEIIDYLRKCWVKA